MTELIPYKTVFNLLDLLRDLKIDWILLGDANEDFPHRLKVSDDIDILVSPSDRKKLSQYFIQKGTNIQVHPSLQFCSISNNQFTFECYPFDTLNLDVVDSLYYCNLLRTKFYPLERFSLLDPFNNNRSRTYNRYEIKTLDIRSYMIFNITKCILWKRHINTQYLHVLNNCMEELKFSEINSLLYPFFEDYSEQIYWDFKNCYVRDTIMNFHKYLGMTGRIPRSIM
jgi:hypothetical protein